MFRYLSRITWVDHAPNEQNTDGRETLKKHDTKGTPKIR